MEDSHLLPVRIVFIIKKSLLRVKRSSKENKKPFVKRHQVQKLKCKSNNVKFVRDFKLNW